MSVDLYESETWSLTLSEERRLMVFVNRVLRRMFGPKSDEVTAEWTQLHKGVLNDLYSLPSVFRVINSRKNIWAGHVALMR